MMSLKDTLQDAISVISEAVPNRYRLTLPSCTSMLDVEHFSGTEGMSELYRYSITFTSSDKDINAETVLRKSATLTMMAGELNVLVSQKVVHGIVETFQRISSSNDQSTY